MTLYQILPISVNKSYCLCTYVLQKFHIAYFCSPLGKKLKETLPLVCRCSQEKQTSSIWNLSETQVRGVWDD